jgi:hypothetical protein
VAGAARPTSLLIDDDEAKIVGSGPSSTLWIDLEDFTEADRPRLTSLAVALSKTVTKGRTLSCSKLVTTVRTAFPGATNDGPQASGVFANGVSFSLRGCDYLLPDDRELEISLSGAADYARWLASVTPEPGGGVLEQKIAGRPAFMARGAFDTDEATVDLGGAVLVVAIPTDGKDLSKSRIAPLAATMTELLAD